MQGNTFRNVDLNEKSSIKISSFPGCLAVAYGKYSLGKYGKYSFGKYGKYSFGKSDPGPRLNIKTVFPRYGDSHVKDKTVGETVLSLTWESLYW